MAVKVLIERRVRRGYESTVWRMLRDMRIEALRTRGYLYGETWQRVDNPRIFMVLSVWASLEHWQEWAQSERRQEINERLNQMLRKPSVVQVFTNAEDPRGA